MKTNSIVWRRHLSEYRSNLGYSIQSPQRGSYWTLRGPEGQIVGRYKKLMLAKEAAENREVKLQRLSLGVGRNGHDVFDSPWGCFDLSVARQLATQRGQADKIVVKKWAEDADKHPVCIMQPQASGPVIVATTQRRGVLASLVIDGWGQVIAAHGRGEEVLDCLVLDLSATELVRLR